MSRLVLMNNANHPWFILIPRIEGGKDIYELEWQDQAQLLNESSMLSEVLMQLFQGTKMNVAALGNICPQLHMHHIVRYETDIDWPHPVWGRSTSIAYDEEQILEIKGKVLEVINSIIE